MSMDYCFLISDEDPATAPKVLVVYDSELDGMWALLVRRKGPSPEVVSWILQKLEEAGRSGQEIALKIDQEESIMALKRSVAVRREAKTVPNESKVRVSKSNPHVERAIRKWRGQFRKLKIEFENSIGKHLPVEHHAVGWLVSWASDVVLKYKEGDDGRTAYERMTGHMIKHKVVGFCESVLFQVAMDHSNRNKYDGEWLEGFFVGVVCRSSEYLVVKDGVVYKCPTIRRKAAETAFDKDCLSKLRAGFNAYVLKDAVTSRVHTYDGQGGGRVPHGDGGVRAYIPRGARLPEDDFDAHKYTQGCPGCSWLQDRIGPRRGHSKACRERIVKLLEETEDGKQRLARARSRFDAYLRDAEVEGEDADDKDGKGNGDELSGKQDLKDQEKLGNEDGHAGKAPDTYDTAVDSPSKDRMDEETFEEGPTQVRESRHGTPKVEGEVVMGEEEAIVKQDMEITPMGAREDPGETAMQTTQQGTLRKQDVEGGEGQSKQQKPRTEPEVPR